MSLTYPVAKFCPNCGTQTEQRTIHGQLRPQCPSCQHIIYFDPKVACIGFITQGDKILLGQRGFSPHKGLWVLPGGFVEYGEHPQDAVKREVLEETGLQVAVGDVIDVFHTSGGSTITIAYHATIIKGTMRPHDDVVALDWFTRDNLPKLAFLSTNKVVERWQKGELA